jgi:hypothetical protein
MSNPCNCIQPIPYSHLFSSLAIVFGAEFCYTTGNYFIEFTHGLISTEPQKKRKRDKRNKRNKSVLPELNARPHEHNTIATGTCTTTPYHLHNQGTLTCTYYPYFEF